MGQQLPVTSSWPRAGTQGALALALLALASCREPRGGLPPDPSASAASGAPILGLDERAHPVGELGHARDYTMSVESVRECALDPPFAPKRGFVKVGLEVAIEGTSALEVPVNPFYGTLIDATGESHPATLAGCEPGLPSIRVAAGRKARGFITFEIPKAAHKLELHYSPLVIGPGVEPLKFAAMR